VSSVPRFGPDEQGQVSAAAQTDAAAHSEHHRPLRSIPATGHPPAAVGDQPGGRLPDQAVHRDDDEVHEHELAAATVVWLIAIGLVARNLIRGG
jgi:hypothetical protein